MKEIYSWVPWFKELGSKIAEGGKDYLIERAQRVAWKDGAGIPPLLKFGDENIDPLSFIYTVASSNGNIGRRRVYPSVSEVFEISSQLDPECKHSFIFPAPPSINTLFHADGIG
ncbi:MAG: hypothetical protein OXD01_13940, partial [Gammaproteobacteria bacterium]|nr:hypothetical protein [Gammaproteobacteria bacterium]